MSLGTGIHSAWGSTFLSLFGEGQGKPVLIIGQELRRWANVFHEALFFSSAVDTIPYHAGYDLIMFSSSAVSREEEFERHLGRISENLSRHGSLLLFARNSFSFTCVRDLIACRNTTRQGFKASYRTFMKMIRSSSFASVQAYLPLPCLETPGELVEVASDLLEIPHYESRVMKLAHEVRAYHHIHDGYVFLCRREGLQSHGLFLDLSGIFREYLRADASEISMDRFDVRERGAVVLFLREKSSSRTFIVRAVTDAGTEGIIMKNHTFLGWLHAQGGAPWGIREKIPVPIAMFSYQGTRIFIESRIPGILAWKVNSGYLRERILDDSILFLQALHASTRQRVRLGREVLDDLFHHDEQMIHGLDCCSDRLRSLFMERVSKIKQALGGQEMWIAVSHGDYGYGNILVDHRDGHLTGVIDWDTGRKMELPFVDLMNLVIQKERNEKGTGFFQSVKNLLEKENFGLLAESVNMMLSSTQQKPSMLRLFFSVALLRYISRSAQYPAVFRHEHEDYLHALDITRGWYLP